MAKNGKARKRLYQIIGGIFLAFCILLELGQLFPETGLPSWDTLFTDTGLTASSTTPEGELEVHILDVGNADCILVRQGAQAMLIDAGERGDQETILQYLQSHGVERLDLVIATHPHADHIGSMAGVIRALPIDRFVLAYMPEDSTPTSSAYLDMLTALDERQVPIDGAKPGAVYTIGTAQVQLLAPLEETSDYNNMSVVSYLTFGKRHFLFMGDAETPVEQAILERWGAVPADVLKAGHHGSRTASSEAFVQQVKPQFAVLTCGYNNRYGHPHEEAIEVFEQCDVAVYRSDVCGHITFVSDGDDVLTVTTEKGAA